MNQQEKTENKSIKIITKTILLMRNTEARF